MNWRSVASYRFLLAILRTPEPRSGRIRLCASLMLALLCGGSVSSASAASSSFYCKNQIIAVGATLTDVLASCGRPIWIDDSETETVTRVSAVEWRVVRQTVSTWLYNLGAGTLTRLLTFENGALIDIKAGDYALNATAQPCQLSALTPGLAKIEVLARCGKPLSEQSYRIQDVVKVQALLRNDPEEWELVRIPTDEWVYQFTPDSPVNILIFQGSLLRDIKTIGESKKPLPKACHAPGIAVGMSKSEILRHCGLPLSQHDRQKAATVIAPNARVFSRDVLVSEWAYLLPNHAATTLTFQDGRLLEIVELPADQ